MIRRMHVCLWVLLVIPKPCEAHSLPDKPFALAEADLRALPPEAAAKLAIAALEWRDKQLANFRYELCESAGYGENKAAPTVTVGHGAFARLRYGSKELLYSQQLSGGAGAGVEGVMSHDGTRYQRFYRNAEKGLMDGQVGEVAASESLSTVIYDHMLGVRHIMLSGSVPEWIATVMRKEWAKQEVRVTSIDGRTLLELTIWEDRFNPSVFKLDPNRDYMPVEYEWRNVTAKGVVNAWDRHRVVDAADVDGLWVPMKVVRNNGNALNAERRGEWTATVTKFTRGTVREKDVVIEFPAGTLVVDSLDRRAWTVAEDGTRKAEPLYNRDAAKVVEPKQADYGKAVLRPMPVFAIRTPEGQIVNSSLGIPVSPRYQARSDEQARDITGAKAMNRAGVAPYLLALSAGTLVVGIFLIARHTRVKSPS